MLEKPGATRGAALIPMHTPRQADSQCADAGIAGTCSRCCSSAARRSTTTGCIATGSTPDDVEREMKDAIAFHLDGLKAEGIAIPRATTSSSYVEIPT